MSRPFLATLVILLAAMDWRASGEEPAAPAPTAEQVDQWIKDLDDDVFLVRERAMDSLGKAGPAALDALAQAADSSNLEVATRAVHVLLQFGEAENPDLAAGALERIAGLRNRPLERGLAEGVLGGLRERRAVAELKRFGARDDDRVTFEGIAPFSMIKIGSDWKGGDEGLAFLKDISVLQNVAIHGAAVSEKGLAHLKYLTNVSSIELFGTGLAAADAEILRKALPNTRVLWRRGAMLGVRGDNHELGAVVNFVEPESAAKDAGIEAFDIITHFNGKPVNGFAGLTEFIGECRPGDQAKLDLLRGEGKVQVEVTFGKWR